MAIRKLKSDLAAARPAVVLIPAYAEYDMQVIPELRQTFDEFVLKGYSLERCLYGFSVYRVRPGSK
jgi:hypothetical protein